MCDAKARTRPFGRIQGTSNDKHRQFPVHTSAVPDQARELRVSILARSVSQSSLTSLKMVADVINKPVHPRLSSLGNRHGSLQAQVLCAAHYQERTRSSSEARPQGSQISEENASRVESRRPQAQASDLASCFMPSCRLQAGETQLPRWQVINTPPVAVSAEQGTAPKPFRSQRRDVLRLARLGAKLRKKLRTSGKLF